MYKLAKNGKEGHLEHKFGFLNLTNPVSKICLTLTFYCMTRWLYSIILNHSCKSSKYQYYCN